MNNNTEIVLSKIFNVRLKNWACNSFLLPPETLFLGRID
jgi:hypothetical protein